MIRILLLSVICAALTKDETRALYNEAKIYHQKNRLTKAPERRAVCYLDGILESVCISRLEAEE